MATPEEEIQEVHIKVMMPADGAQAVAGKLYVLGGGFDRITIPSLPAQYKFDLAMLIEVPWSATNQPYQLVVELLDADGQAVGYRAEATMETGRPPGMRRGASLIVPVAMPVFAEFQEVGRYVLRGAINGEERNRVSIEVATGAPQAPPIPQEH
jgi:hypothetical protein